VRALRRRGCGTAFLPITPAKRRYRTEPARFERCAHHSLDRDQTTHARTTRATPRPNRQGGPVPILPIPLYSPTESYSRTRTTNAPKRASSAPTAPANPAKSLINPKGSSRRIGCRGRYTGISETGMSACKVTMRREIEPVLRRAVPLRRCRCPWPCAVLPLSIRTSVRAVH
jgi:hypothetical protein